MLKQQSEKFLAFDPARLGDAALIVLVTKRDSSAIISNEALLTQPVFTASQNAHHSALWNAAFPTEE